MAAKFLISEEEFKLNWIVYFGISYIAYNCWVSKTFWDFPR